MGNCQTKGATAVAERQAPLLDSRSYSIDLGGDDSDDTSVLVEDDPLLVSIGHQGSESNEHKISNLKPLGTEETIAAMLLSDKANRPQGSRPSIPKIPEAVNEDKQCLYPSVSFPIMDELDELVASMSMPMEPAEDDSDVQNEDDAGYVSSSSSSAAGTPQAVDGVMVPFSGTPATNANADASASASGTTTNDKSDTCEGTTAIETQLVVSESRDFCAYGLGKEETSAATASSGGTQMVVVHEHHKQKTEANAQVPTSRHFTFQDVKEEEQLREYARPPTTSPEMMLTPPNDPDKGYPQDLYLSPPTPENEIDEDDGHGFLVLPPFAPEIAQANTTDIVLHPSSSHNYGDFLSSANAEAAMKPNVKQTQGDREGTTTGDKPKQASKNNKVGKTSENEVHSIVEFIPKRSPVESSNIVHDSLVLFEKVGKDKFVHDFSEDDRDDTPANECLKSEARDLVEEGRGSDGTRTPVEGEVEVQLGVSGSLISDDLLVSGAEEQNRKNSGEVTAMVKGSQLSRNAYGGIEVAIESSEKGGGSNKDEESLKEEGGAICPSQSRESKESRKEEEDNTRLGCDEAKHAIEVKPRPELGTPCPDVASYEIDISTEHSKGQIGSAPTFKASSGPPSGGGSVASMTHLSRRARNLRKNKPRAYTKKTSDDTETSEAAPVDFLCITESRSVDTEVSDLHSVFTDATPLVPSKVVTATESSSGPTRGRMSHRSAQIERLRSTSTTRRGRVNGLPTGDKCPNSNEAKPTTSPVHGTSLPPKATERSEQNGESRYSNASARKLAKVRRARSRSRSVARTKSTPSADSAKVEETNAAAVDHEEKKTQDKFLDIPVSKENSSSTDEEASVSDRHGRPRPRPRPRSISRPRTLRERKALASASDTASVDAEKSTVSETAEKKRPTTRPHSRTRLSERKARAAQTKAASHETLSSVSSLESPPSIETTETTSTSEMNAENNAGVGNSSTSEVDKGCTKTLKELNTKEKMKKKRLERARRLRAIQH